jgi:putative glutamine amidotransferase
MSEVLNLMPLIGICTDHVAFTTEGGKDRSYLKLYPSYVQSVIKAGGTPVLLPIVDDLRVLKPALARLDGVVMIGSDDYPPQWYGAKPHAAEEYCTPERAKFDRALATYLYNKTDLPLLLVCGGMQLACILSGGVMLQHLPDVTNLEHRDFKARPETTTHPVNIERGTVLHRALGVTRTVVNSMHHQAAKNVGKRLRVCARADDGTIEAVEFTDHPWRVGTQWHPERMPTDKAMPRLFKAFVRACKRR